uniref:Uncharacterized protein n=1 Tax=Anas zonorhyncha TaxID=75864 RepID=A0A8B9U9E5_9AVES
MARRYWSLSVLGSAGGLGGRAGWLRASSVSHCTSTRRYSSMAVWASSTDECPQLTWIFLCSRCLARLLSEALALRGSPAFWFSSGIRLVSRVLSLGWKYLRAWKSLWMAYWFYSATPHHPTPFPSPFRQHTVTMHPLQTHFLATLGPPHGSPRPGACGSRRRAAGAARTSRSAAPAGPCPPSRSRWPRI